MKMNYGFIKELREILFSHGDEWKSKILESIKTKQDKIPTLKEKGIDTSGLEISIAKLQEDLTEGRYSWNVEPFTNLSDAKFLLTNLHLLHDPFLTQKFNPAAVTAIQNMLSTNFSKIYDESVFLQRSEIVIEAQHHITSQTISKIRQPSLHLEAFDIDDFMPPEDDIYDDLTPDEEQNIISYIIILTEHLSTIDRGFLAKVATSWSLVAKCYAATDIKLFDITLPIALALFFNNMKDIDSFLTNHVDYSSSISVENSFILAHTIEPIKYFTPDERTIWSNINAKYGKKAMSIFAKHNDIRLVLGRKFDSLFKENNNDVDAIFKQLQVLSKQVQFTHALENQALADLAYKYGYSEQAFNKILREIIPKAKASDDLPDVRFSLNYHGQDFQFQKLPAGDLRGLFLGKMTGCCQSIDGDAEASVIDGFTRQDVGFYILTDKAGKVKAQSLAWIGTNPKGQKALVLDSFEHNHDVTGTYIPTMKALLHALQQSHPDFTELYIGTGGHTPRTQAYCSNDIVSPEGMHRYDDSKYAYLITEDIALKKDDAVEVTQYNSFEEYADDNPAINFYKLSEEYPDLLESIYDKMPYKSFHDVKTIRLIRESEQLRTFLEEQIKPGSEFIIQADEWRFHNYNDVTITTFHKLSIIKVLLDSGYNLKELIIQFQASYNINPAILEMLGYDNLLQIQQFSASALISDTHIPKIAALTAQFGKQPIDDRFITFLHMDQEVIDYFGIDEIMQHVTAHGVKSIAYHRRTELTTELTIDQKIIITGRLLDGSLGEKASNIFHMVQYTPAHILSHLGIDKIIDLMLSTSHGGVFYFNKDKVSNDTQLKIIDAILSKYSIDKAGEIIVRISQLNHAILNDFDLTKILELNDKHSSIFYHLQSQEEISASKLKLIKMLLNGPDKTHIIDQLLGAQEDILEYFGLERLVHIANNTNFIHRYLKEEYSDYDSVSKSWITFKISFKDRVKILEFLEMMPKETDLKLCPHLISEIGLDNVLHLAKSKGFYGGDIQDLSGLKSALTKTDIPEELHVSGKDPQCHGDVHIAKHIIIDPGSEFTTQFPILGWYNDVPDSIYCYVQNPRQSDECYLIGNNSNDTVTIDHI